MLVLKKEKRIGMFINAQNWVEYLDFDSDLKILYFIDLCWLYYTQLKFPTIISVFDIESRGCTITLIVCAHIAVKSSGPNNYLIKMFVWALNLPQLHSTKYRSRLENPCLWCLSKSKKYVQLPLEQTEVRGT